MPIGSIPSGLPLRQDLFERDVLANSFRRRDEVSADGARLVVNGAPASVRPPAIHVVMDWHALLYRREN